MQKNKKYLLTMMTFVFVIAFTFFFRKDVNAAEKTGTVTFSIERFTIGQGYLIEPCQVDIYDTDNIASVVDRVLTQEGYGYENKGKIENSFYLEQIYNGDTGKVRIPSIISDGQLQPIKNNKGNLIPIPTNAVNDGNDYGNESGHFALGEFAYCNMSGWMYTVNNVFPTGMSLVKPKDGDIIRLQFTLYGYGRDLGEKPADEEDNNYFALTAIGVDARNVMGHNLLAYLSDYENVSRQGNNGTIWALIALKSNPAYEIPENPSAEQQNSEKLMVQKIVEMQCADGGWTLMGTTGDSDMTGMAMQALASYYNKDGYEDVTAAIDKGLAWIEKNQLSSGGFGTMNTETSESVAQIITALCGVGIDCGEDARFIKNGKWPMTGLFQYYMPEGGFMHVAADAGNNGGGAGGIIDGMATEQGLYATVAYRRFLDGETFLYDMSDVAISAGTKPVVSPTIDTGSNSGGNSSSTTAKKTETKPAASKVKVIKVGLNYSTIYLTKGKSKTLKATVSPSNATKKSVKWSSSNKKIATVNAKGKVTGKKAGTATITVKAKDGSGKKATCKVVVTAPATATTAKKTTTTTAARSQTKRITTPTSGTTNRSVSTGSGTPTASGTTKTLSSGSTSGTGTGSTASKSATGTTAKKKDTAVEATTGSWNFSGEDYVPDTYAADETDAAEADTTAEKDNDTSKIVAGLGIFYIVKRICAIAVVVIIAFILYKKRHRIASALRNFQKGGDKE